MIYTHDPQARLDYTQDWSAWLAGIADTLTSVVWTCDDAGTTLLPIDGLSTGKPGVWVSGTLLEGTVALTCHIVTANGRQDDRTDYLVIRQR